LSEIDSFQHKCIGMVSCPSSFLPSSYWRHPERVIPVYRLDEDALDATSLSAKQGDLLLGGGSGECPALRISLPEAFYLLGREADPAQYNHEKPWHAYWSIDDAFVFGDGYVRLGWQPLGQPMELWLTAHIVAFVLREYPEAYGDWKDSSQVELIGAICRRPTAEELAEL
jgi:hypothetical protein